MREARTIADLLTPEPPQWGCAATRTCGAS